MKIFDKKEIVETFNNYLVNIGPNLATSIPENKTTFQNYIHYDGPCLIPSILRLRTGKCICKPRNKSSGYDDISADIV